MLLSRYSLLLGLIATACGLPAQSFSVRDTTYEILDDRGTPLRIPCSVIMDANGYVQATQNQPGVARILISQRTFDNLFSLLTNLRNNNSASLTLNDNSEEIMALHEQKVERMNQKLDLERQRIGVLQEHVGLLQDANSRLSTELTRATELATEINNSRRGKVWMYGIIGAAVGLTAGTIFGVVAGGN